MARWSFVNGFVRLRMPRSVLDLWALRSRTALLQSTPAAPKPGAGSAAAPTAATSGARKDGSIIATANADTAVAGRA